MSEPTDFRAFFCVGRSALSQPTFPPTSSSSDYFFLDENAARPAAMAYAASGHTGGFASDPLRIIHPDPVLERYQLPA